MAVRKIETELALTGEKAFNDAMKAVNSNLKTLRSDMAAVSAEFDENANSVDALTAKNKILQDSVEQQRVKVDALRQMYEKTAKASGENSAAADKWKQQLNFATVELAKQEKELRKNNAALDEARRAADSAENAVEDMADAADEVARSAGKASDSLEEMSDTADKADGILPRVAAGFGNVAAGAAQAGAAVLAVAAGLGTAAVTTMVSFARESAEAAKAAADAGETLSETQQAWLAYSDKLEGLDSAAAKAKRAIGGILLPQLSELSTDGADYLRNFAQSMEEAAGDSEKQAEVISEYAVEGARLLREKLPEYVQTGKILLGGVKDGLKEMAPELWAAAGPLLQDFLNNLEAKGPEVVSKLVTGITDALPKLGELAGDMVYKLTTYLLDNLDEIAAAGLKLGVAFMEAIAEAIGGAVAALHEKLSGVFSLLSTNMHFQTTGTFQPMNIPGYESGLYRVPYDDYLARLHKDEMVLTAGEAALYRSGRGPGRTVYSNITIHTQHLTPEEMERILDTIDRKLGDAM